MNQLASIPLLKRYLSQQTKVQQTKTVSPIASPFSTDPADTLLFIFSSCGISAKLCLQLNQHADIQATYRFKIKGTNRKDYSLSEFQGVLKHYQNKIVVFRMKQNASLNRNVNDRFEVQVWKQINGWREGPTFFRALRISITSSSAIRRLPQVESRQKSLTISCSQKISKLVQVEPRYTSPTVKFVKVETLIDNPDLFKSMKDLDRQSQLNDLPHLRKLSTVNSIHFDQRTEQMKLNSETNYMNNQNEKTMKVSTRSFLKTMQNSGQSTKSRADLELELQKLKKKFNRSSVQLREVQKKAVVSQCEINIQHARTRFSGYGTVLLIVFCFFLGIMANSLHIPDRMSAFQQSIKEYL